MKRIKQLSLAAAILVFAAVTQTAFACSPPPLHIMNKTVGIEAKLPMAKPVMTIPDGAGGGPCPYVGYPQVFASTTDAGIVKYLGTDPGAVGLVLAPAWDATKVYVAGNTASYTGKNYKARWWTQGDTPSASSAVWEEQADAYGNPAGWSSAAAYQAASKVTYNGNIYSAKWWTQGETPGTVGSAWVLVGPAIVTTLKRPANFSYSISGTTGYGGTWTTESFALSDSPLADSWQVHVNGVLVQQGASISTVATSCPAGSTTCVPRYVQSAAVPVSLPDFGDTFVIWVCAKSACRPTWRITLNSAATEIPTVVP
jgi:chitodextrinase